MPEEILNILDQNAKSIGTATRNNIHQQGLLHAEVCLYLMQAGNIGLQKKIIGNNKTIWTHSVSGHVLYNETPLQALVREAKEELGIDISTYTPQDIDQFHRITQRNGKTNNRITYLYLLEWNGEIPQPHNEEVNGFRFFTPQHIESLIQDKLCTDSCAHIYKTYLLPYLNGTCTKNTE
ncbi:MAG: NUDIX hydrolase [Candidatus Woesearchaeota archaeon]